MPYTIIYEQAPNCAYCGRPMHSWTAFAEIHYHEQCYTKKCSEETVIALQAIVDKHLEQRAIAKN